MKIDQIAKYLNEEKNKSRATIPARSCLISENEAAITLSAMDEGRRKSPVTVLRHEVAGEYYTHQHLWNSVKFLLTQPETRTPKDGYFQTAGMLMAYLTFEAYLNLIGPRVDRAAWKDERKFFTKNPYRGTPGKLKRICETCNIQLNASKRPYRTIRELKRLRDFLAHGKVQSYGFSVHAKEGQHPDLFRNLDIYKMVTRKTADRALQDTEEFIEFLHAKVNQKSTAAESPYKALQYPLAWATGVGRRL